MKFIYALNEDDRKYLIKRGYRELFSCYIGENKAYAFENTSKIAIFNNEDKKKFLFTNMAYFKCKR